MNTTADATAHMEHSTQARQRRSKAWHVLAPGETRTPRPLNIVGEEVLVQVSPGDSNGELALFQATVPPHSGPPLHVHSREDEWFFVLSGELLFEVDGERHTVSSGGSVYLRRGVAHTYQNFTGAEAQLLVATTPGEFFNFFVELDHATPLTGLPSAEVLSAVCEKYGMTILGPPLS
jgi:mannose-6-phosphate isomerase-like protein (cupin superfamily)